jgi:hypothetical protein
MLRLFALFLFVSLNGAAVAQAPPSLDAATQQALIAKSRAVMESLKSKDPAMLKTLLADDFRTISSDGNIYGKGELLGAAQEGDLKAFTMYAPQVIAIDDHSALVTYNTIITMPEGDDGFAPRYQKISDLWVKHGDDWQLKFEQSTPLRHID